MRMETFSAEFKVKVAPAPAALKGQETIAELAASGNRTRPRLRRESARRRREYVQRNVHAI